MRLLLKIGLALVLFIVLSHQQNCTITRDSDILLPNLASHIGQQQGNCCNICKITPGCKAFAWNARENGTCWLKSATGPVVAKIGFNAGIISQEHSGGVKLDCSIMTSSDSVNLPESASYQGQSQENCHRICSSSSSCKGFVWDETEGGSCWLKAGVGPLLPNNHFYVGIMGAEDAQISFDEFSNAVANSNGYPRPSQAQYNAFMQGIPKGLITSKQEAAMALTQFLHESDGLRAKREYRCVTTGCPGEYVTPGCDAGGQHYFGRGYIQLSWCYNYRAASQDLFRDARLIADPDMVARDENLAWNSAFWFWKVNVHNRAGVANGDFGVTTRAINGGLECDNTAGHSIARHRYEMYGRVRAAFGLPGPGNERGCYN
uniref:Chitinase n=1 Tax=Bradysia odoriphaga TaxID=1564500 RepID=A0A385GLJ0_9DIPT|nr:chitinase [Bradysia odoriphaga]